MVGGAEINADVRDEVGTESLTAVAVVSPGDVTLVHFGDGHTSDTKNTERLFYGLEFGRGDDGGDELHGHPFFGAG
jgi:hypothetical protein